MPFRRIRRLLGRNVQRHQGRTGLTHAVSMIALCCALCLSVSSVKAQESDNPLRGAVDANGNPIQTDASGTPINDEAAAPRPEGEIDPFSEEVIPQEEDAGLSPEDKEKEEAERLRRRKQSESVTAGPEASLSGFGATANDRTAGRRQREQKRKGTNVNQLTDKKEKGTRAESVRGLKPLEKPPNTAVNTKGEVPAPPGLTVSEPEVRDGQSTRRKKKSAPGKTNPYDPVGIRSGAVTFFPSISTAAGYDTNPRRRSSNAEGSLFNRTAIGLRLEGDFGASTLTGEATGSYDSFLNDSGANKPSANAVLGYEMELGASTSLESGLRLKLSTEEATSVNLPATTSEDAWRIDGGATLGATQRFGRTALRLRGTVDREQYFEARQQNGSTIAQDDRNATELGLSLRAGYEISPGFQPFAEIGADQRFFDDSVDRSGFRRNSYGVSGKAGFAFDIDTVITGEAFAGYALRTYSDDRLEQFGGFVFGGTIAFAATPLTTLRLSAESEIEDTTLAGSSGAFSRTATIGIEHELLRNLQLSASLALAQRQPDAGGADWTVRSTLGAEYRFTPDIVATGSYGYEQQWADQSVNNYDAHTILFGLKLQR